MEMEFGINSIKENIGTHYTDKTLTHHYQTNIIFNSRIQTVAFNHFALEHRKMTVEVGMTLIPFKNLQNTVVATLFSENF